MADNFLERRYEHLQVRKSAVRPTAPKAPGERRIGIITGGANGIGRCLVDAFVDKGYKIYFIDKDSEQIAAVERSMQGRRGTAIGFAGDIAEQKRIGGLCRFRTGAGKTYPLPDQQRLPDAGRHPIRLQL